MFREGQSLNDFLARHLPVVRDRSVIVVTSKIVALAEGRFVACRTERERVRLIRQESQWSMKTKYTWLTIKDGMVLANAGIDQSNADGKCVLLPRDSFKSAVIIRRFLLNRFRLKRLGVIITDSRITPLREGVSGVAIGFAGFRGLRDYRGQPDLFGRRLEMTRTNVADSLAAAAVLLMGEAAERKPLAVIERAPVVFRERVRRTELLIDPKEDMYRPLFERLGGGTSSGSPFRPACRQAGASPSPSGVAREPARTRPWAGSSPLSERRLTRTRPRGRVFVSNSFVSQAKLFVQRWMGEVCSNIESRIHKFDHFHRFADDELESRFGEMYLLKLVVIRNRKIRVALLRSGYVWLTYFQKPQRSGYGFQRLDLKQRPGWRSFYHFPDLPSGCEKLGVLILALAKQRGVVHWRLDFVRAFVLQLFSLNDDLLDEGFEY